MPSKLPHSRASKAEAAVGSLAEQITTPYKEATQEIEVNKNGCV